MSDLTPKIAEFHVVPGVESKPTTPQRLLLLCMLALGAGVGIARWIEIRAAASFTGTLQSRTTTISAPCLAKLRELSVVPGQRVIPGEKLMELTDDRLISELTAKNRELTESDAELKRVTATAEVELEWRRRELQAEMFETRLKLSKMTQERQTKQVEHLAWKDYLNERSNALASGGDVVNASTQTKPIFIDANAGDERRLEMMLKEDAALAATETLSEQIHLCEEQLNRLKKLEDDLPTKIRISTGVDLAETRLARVRDEITSLERQRESLTVVSPAHGIVGAIRRTQGDLVQPGEAMLELYDDERRHLIASIPSSSLAKVKPGAKLTLIFPARQRRIGLVTSIPPQVQTQETSSEFDDSYVDVRIEPAGKLWPKLPVGSRVKVQVIQ